MRLVVLSLFLANPAFADDPSHEGPPVEHGEGTEPAGHGEGEGEGHEGHASGGHHVDYVGDANHNGVPDWRDASAGEAYIVSSVVQHLINLLILLAALYWFFRRPVSDALANRAHDIQKDLGEAARLRAEAEARHVELTARIQAFEGEVEKMKAQAAVDAKAEEERLVARAHEESARIAATAQRNIRDEVARARTTLQTEAVDLAMKLAENTLRNNVKSEDQQALARQFLASLEGATHGR
jgi:F-type H+-transporting ATPase subunit b